MRLLYTMEHGFLVHFRGKFRGEIEGLKIKAVLFSRWECSTKVPNNLVSIIISHLILTLIPSSGFRGRFR